MRRSRFHRLVTLPLLAALLAGCPAAGVAPTAPKKPAGKPSAAPAPSDKVGLGAPGLVGNNGGAVVAADVGALSPPGAPAGPATLTGKVKAPAGVVANNGGSVIANNGGNVAGSVGSGSSGGSVIANNGGNLLSDKGVGYRLAQAPAQVPLAGVEVRLLDAAGQPVLGPDGKPLTARTDAEGGYAFRAALPARNLLVEVALAGGGAVKAIAPRDAGAQRAVDVDVVSTLTTGYIVDRYVRPQADPLATLEKLPGDVEAETRKRAGAALAGGQVAVAALTPLAVVDTLEALRRADKALDEQMVLVEKLLVVAGARDLGDGKPGLTVALGDLDDLAVAKDGVIYVLAGQDRRVWRLRADGILETAIGDRAAPDANERLDGQKGVEASLDRPRALGLDREGRLLLAERRGAYRLEADGTLRDLGGGPEPVAVAAAGDAAIVARVEALAAAPAAPGDEEDFGPMPGPSFAQAYGFYRCQPGAAPVRLFQEPLDPGDDGAQTVFLRGLAWDGGATLAYMVHGGGGFELRRRPLAGGEPTVDWSGPNDAHIDAGGRLLVAEAGGVVKARPALGDGPETTLPPGVPGMLVRYALGPGGEAYATQFDRVYKLGAGGPVAIAGTGGSSQAGGDATAFTFRVLSDVAVTPSGGVYAVDTGKGAVFQVDGQRQIGKLGDAGGGGVQILRSDPAGTLWMADGNGTGIGAFDAGGTWTKRLEVPGVLLADFAVAADGTIWAATWDTGSDQKRRVRRLKGGANEVMRETPGGNFLALDATGTPWVAGGGELVKWDGAAFQVVKRDARFDFGLTTINGPGLAFDAKGRLYLAVPSLGTITRYDPAGDAFVAIAGKGGKHFTGTGSEDGIKDPRTPCLDAAGNLYFSDPGNRQIKRIAASELD